MIERTYTFTDADGVRWRNREVHETWLGNLVSEIADKTVDEIALEAGAFALATLKKRTTDDGLFEVRDNIAVGKEYLIGIGAARMTKGYNTIKKQHWERMMVADVVTGGLLPLELLDIKTPPNTPPVAET